MATEQDLVLDQGGMFRQTVSVTIDGVVTDLSGWTARMQIRGDRRNAATLLATLASTGVSPALTVVGPQAQVLIDIPGATSLTWTWTRAQYDLVIYNPGGQAYRVLQGHARLNQAVTLPT